MNEENVIRDLVYFDISKATSLLSQFTGGLPTEIVETTSKSQQTDKGIGGNIHFVQGDISKQNQSSEGISETKTLHHDLLDRVESHLFENGFCIDLNEASKDGELDGKILRELIDGYGYIRIEGDVKVHDFRRLSTIAENFDKVTSFVNQSVIHTFKDSAFYKQIEDEISKFDEQIKAAKDKNEKNRIKQRKKAEEKKIKSLLEESVNVVDSVPDWMVEGVSNWISLYNKDQIHLRVFPSKSIDGSEILANLKRECFIDSEVDYIRFAYGNQPNIRLTLFGLITSVPSKENSIEFDQEIEEDASDTEKFQNAMYNIFEALEQVEKFSDYDQYPNIKVFPIAVYRMIKNK